MGAVIAIVILIIVVMILRKHGKANTDKSPSPSINNMQSITKPLKDYVVIDVETTGLNSEDNSIVEVACLKIRDNKIMEEYSQLIDPCRPIPKDASDISGITDEMVKGQPCFDMIGQDVLDFIGKDILVGHNILFDVRFLEKELGESLPNATLDTYRVAKAINVDSCDFKLKTLCKHLNISEEQDHRALSDAILTHKLLERLFEEAANSGLTITITLNSEASNVKHRQISIKDLKPLQPPRNDTQLSGKRVVFTGDVPGMYRKRAMIKVLEAGGSVGEILSKKTDYLVVGLNPGNLKIEKAKELKANGQDINIIEASQFIEMLET